MAPASEWSPLLEFQEWTVVRVAEGAGYCLHQGSARDLQAGDGFTVPHSTRVTVRASRLGPLRLQHFLIRPELLGGLLTVTESLLLKSLPDHASYVSFFKANEPTGQKFLQLLKEPGNRTLAARCGLLQLWAAGIAGLFSPSDSANTGGTKLRDRFVQLVEMLPQAELLNFSPSEFARQLNCSQRHFQRLFLQKFGVPFRSHQIEVRLLRASHLLADSSIKIASIAHESGYQHLGLFNATFKKRFGVTPTEWRRRISPAHGSGERGAASLPLHHG